MQSSIANRCNVSCATAVAGYVLFLQVEHVQQFRVLMRIIVLMSVPHMMIVNMIGYVVVMDVEDTLVLTLLKCVQ